jgi:dTDP-4-amino-4,6-dideoxygalactose transaminase
MTDIQAALGISQLEKLDAFIARRRELAHRYGRVLANLPVKLPLQDPDGASAWHLYVIRLKLDKISQSHQQVFEKLRGIGIGVNLHYIPVYQQPYYSQMDFHTGCCPQAEQYYSEAISIPIYPYLTETQQNKIVTALKQTLTA